MNFAPIFGLLLHKVDALKQFNQDSKVIACATAHSNKRMQKLLAFKGLKQIEMKFFAKYID